MAKPTSTEKVVLDTETTEVVETSAPARATRSSAKPKVATEETVSPSMSDIMSMMEKMQSQLSAITTENEKIKEENTKLKQEAQNTTPVRNYKDEDVTIIYNWHGTLEAHLHDLDLYLSTFGEQREVTYTQFQQLIGKYRRFFEKEYIVLDERHMDLAQKHKIVAYRSDSKSFVHHDEIDKLKNLTVVQLEDYYTNLSRNSRAHLLSFWLNKCYDKDPDYYDVSKMSALDRASRGNTFQYFIQQMNKKS